MNPFINSINGLLPEPHASLLNGILWGTKAAFPRQLYQDMVTTGVLHIIALSGMNITILINLVSRTTYILGKKISVICSGIFIILFIWFVGASPSVVRAGLMGVMSLAAVYLGRQSWAFLSLLLSAGLMLLYDMSLWQNISFQLSFLATLGIILANKSPERQNIQSPLRRVTTLVWENLRLTLAAQLFTLPVMVVTFHRLSLISPLANLLIEWAIQPIMILGFVTALLAWCWQPLGIIPAWITWTFLSYVLTVIGWLAGVPMASIRW